MSHPSRLPIVVIILLVVIGFTLFFFQPSLNVFSSPDQPCGITSGGMYPTGLKPPNRLCLCFGLPHVVDERAYDGDRNVSCSGLGISFTKRIHSYEP